MNVRYRVELSQVERTGLKTLLSSGKHASRKLKRAQVLLARAGASDEEIAGSVGVAKRRFVEGNLERALSEQPRPGAERKLCWWRPPVPAPKGPCPLDAQAAGRCDGQAHRAQEPVARDGSATPCRK